MGAIRITKHAADRYIEKFNPNLAAIVNVSERIRAVTNDLLLVFEASKYIGKNNGGKLYRSYLLKIDMIVRDGAMVTLFPLKRPLRSERERKVFHPFEMERN